MPLTIFAYTYGYLLGCRLRCVSNWQTSKPKALDKTTSN